jgi:hypothetical protein
MPLEGLERLDGVLLDGLEFCLAAYAALDAMRAQSGSIEELRLQGSPQAKRLREEVLPIAAFVQARYSAGSRLQVRWLSGNQPYDAQLYYRGPVVEALGIPREQYLEVVTAVQATQHLVREQTNETGGAFSARGTSRDPRTGAIVSVPVAAEYADTARLFVSLILDRIGRKASGGYPADTSLLVNCDLGDVVLQDEWRAIAQSVTQSLQGKDASFVEVALYHHANAVVAVAGRHP